MKLMGGRMAGNFDYSHNKLFGKGLNGLDIVRPDKWLNHDALEEDGKASRFDENVNYLETNPQIFIVSHASAKHEYLPGDKVFVNYMAFEWAESTEYGEIIDTDFIMFQIMPDDSFVLIKDLYLGEPIFSEEVVTPGGIFLSGGKKDNLRVKITHVPPNNTVKIGDTVVAIDKNNYEFNYGGKRYIKLMEHEIVGIVGNKETALNPV